MRSAIVVVLLAAGVGVAVWRLLPPPDGKAPRSSVPAWTGGRLRKVPGMTVLRLAGTPRERGRAHGEHLRERIRARLERLRPPAIELETIGPRAARALPPALREEIEGIAEGCGLPFEQVWYLNVRFDLAAFEAAGFAGEAAVSARGDVLRRFDDADLEGDPRELCVFVHLVDPPVVLVGLPGMAGGFLGCGPAGGAALRPVENAPDPVLTGLAWPLLLRLLVSAEGEPALPAPATLDASVAMVRGEPGTFDLSPRGALWHPSGAAYALARAEPLSETSTPEEGSTRLGVERAKRLFEAPPPPRGVAVLLAPAPGGVSVVVHRDGVRFAEEIRLPD